MLSAAVVIGALRVKRSQLNTELLYNPRLRYRFYYYLLQTIWYNCHRNKVEHSYMFHITRRHDADVKLTKIASIIS